MMEVLKMTGVCKFCGQTSVIDAPEGTSYERAAEIATMQCNCKDALSYQHRISSEKQAEDYVEQWSNEKAERMDALKAIIRAISHREIKKATIKFENITITISDSNGEIKIKKTYTDSEEDTF